LAHLTGNVLDAERARQRNSWSHWRTSLTRSARLRRPNTSLASPPSGEASGFDWVVIETYDETGEVMLERTLNVARYSATDTAASWRNDKVVPTGTGQLQFGAALARAGKPFLMPDVHDEQAWERRQQANPVDPVPLRKFYERAHIVSTAVFPVVFQQKALGGISFASSTPHAFEAAEVEFLTALVAQAATAIKGLRLYQELQDSREEIRQREEWFRSLVQHASDLITVIDAGRRSGARPGGLRVLDSGGARRRAAAARQHPPRRRRRIPRAQRPHDEARRHRHRGRPRPPSQR
jgi:PAS domain-containing protein